MEIQDEEKDIWDAELKHRERLYVLHYCTDDATFLNATASYKAAYRKKDRETGQTVELDNEVCQAAASRLMKKDKIKLAISRLLKMTQAELDEKDSYQLLHDAFLLSTYNPADLINADGTLKVENLNELGELAKCVTDIIPTKYGLHIKLADRSKFMATMLQYLNLIRPEIKVDAQLPVIEMVQKSIDPEAWNQMAEQTEK